MQDLAKGLPQYCILQVRPILNQGIKVSLIS